MDNLDRTNVAQAAFAKWTLDQQLKSLGILNEHESIETYDILIKDFRESEILLPSLIAFCSLTNEQCGLTTPTRFPSRTAAQELSRQISHARASAQRSAPSRMATSPSCAI